MKKLKYFYMNTAELLDTIFYIYKQTFFMQLIKSLIIGVIGYIILFIGIFIFAFSFSSMTAFSVFNSNPSDILSSYLVPIIILSIVLILFFSAWQGLDFSCSYSLSKQAFYGKKPTLETMFKEISSSFLPAFTSAIAIFIFSLPFIVIVGFLFYYFFSNFDSIAITAFINLNPITSIVFIFLFVIIFTIAIYMITTLLICALPAAINEKRLFFSSIIKSFQLIKGSYLKILGTLILWFFTLLIIRYSITAFISLFSSLINYISGSVLDYTILLGFFTFIEYFVAIGVGILVGPFNGIISSVIYFNQKMKKEGLDIEIEVGSLI